MNKYTVASVAFDNFALFTIHLAMKLCVMQSIQYFVYPQLILAILFTPDSLSLIPYDWLQVIANMAERVIAGHLRFSHIK